MINTLGTIRFNLRTDKALKDGACPIELIYSVSQQRKYYNTGIKLLPAYWDAKIQAGRFISNREAKRILPEVSGNQLMAESEIIEINYSLSSLVNEIESIERVYKANKTAFTSEMVIVQLKAVNKGLTKKAEPANLIYDFMDQYIADHKETREPGSLTVYKSVKNHLLAYQDATRHKVTFDTIDYNFFNKFQSFLITRTKTDKAGNVTPMLNNTTIAKALSTLKTFLGYARMQGMKVNDGYKSFAIKKESLEVIALEQQELDALLSLDLSANKRLEKTRDIFCFSCATGLRYSDVAQLKNEHIKDNAITLTVKKTKKEHTIPLNSVSGMLLDKYGDLNRPLPPLSNQKLNNYIKEVCKLAGINTPVEIVRFSGKQRLVTTYPKYELIHFHTARKTFVTLSLEKGMNSEEVMEISGHSDYRSFKRYVKITEKRKKHVMGIAWGEVTKLKVV